MNISILTNLGIKLGYNFWAFFNFLQNIKNSSEKQHDKNWEQFPHDAFYVYRFEILEIINKVSLRRLKTELDNFLLSRIDRIGMLISRGELQTRLHRARKIIKDIKYGLELSGAKSMDFYEKRITIQRITQLEDSVGQWHDWYIFFLNLQRFFKIRKNKRYYLNIKYRDLFVLTDKTLISLQKKVSDSITRQFIVPALNTNSNTK